MLSFRFAILLLSLLIIDIQSVASAHEDAVIDRVLAEPTRKEILDVLQTLQQKDLRPRDFKKHYTLPLSNGNSLQVVSHSSECGIHFGAVILPKQLLDQDAPVMIFAAGGDGIHTELNVATDFSHKAAQFPAFLGKPLDEKFIVVIPAFRGQTLVVGDKAFRSAGNAGDAFDGAATDTISLLNVVLQEYRFANDHSIGIYGGSRGGAVALLVAARDERIKRAVIVATPTDMKKLYLLYPEQFKKLFYDDLVAGRITERVARAKFIASSPIYFADQLPGVQLHQDKNDPFVPLDFATLLIKKLHLADKKVDAHFYDEGEHGFPSSPDFWTRVQAFIRPLHQD